MYKFGLFLAIIFSVLTVHAHPSLPADLKPEQLRVYGQGNPVSMYVFTSYSCPHCSVFHKDVLPQLMQFVEQGKAQITLVEMPFDARAMTGTVLSRCLPASHYEKFSTAMFDNQKIWGTSQNPKPIITGYAKLLGMSDDTINACLSNKPLLKKITEQRNNLSELYHVTAMPTVVVVQGNQQKSYVGSDANEIITGIHQSFGL